MDLRLRLATPEDLEGIVGLSLLAWAPVFRSFEAALGTAIFGLIYPEWPRQQREVVERICTDSAHATVWVADVDATVAGFIAYTMNIRDRTGEVELLAVHPAYQNRGVGAALNNLALERMAASGMTLAVVGTGGDPGHAAARRSYEKAGYTALPLVRYYKDL